MKTCDKCNITIQTQYTYCPLCHQKLTGSLTEDHVELYPLEDITDTITYKAQRVIFFFMLFSVIVLGTINVFTIDMGSWSFIPISAILYLWLLLRYVIFNRTRSIIRVTLTTLFLSMFVVFINFRTGGELWSLNYVLPSLIIANNTTIFIMLLAKTEGFKYNLFHMVLLILVSLFPLLFYYVDIVEYPLLSLLAFIHGLVILLHLLVFHPTVFKELLKRIFHL